MAPQGSGPIRRYGLVRVGMVLLEEVCHCGGGLWGLIYAQAMPSETDHFLLPVSQDVRTLSSFSSTRSAYTLPCFPL